MTQSNKLRVAVLFGGRSGEHEVSVRSAASVIAALDRTKYDVIPVAITKQGRWLPPVESSRLLPASVEGSVSLGGTVSVAPEPAASAGADVVFPVLHGTYGEDGTVQGLLELANVPYVGSGVLGSAAGMDKDVMKRLFYERGLASVPHIAVPRRRREQAIPAVEQRFGYPVFVKPANLGSSVGVRKAVDREALRAALDEAARYDRKLVVEPAIDGREIECAVLGNDEPEASVAGEIIPHADFYDYAAKYETDSAELVIPANLTPGQHAEVRRLAVEAFRAVDARGLARVDFFVERGTGKALLNEINTMPGFTSISMYPKLWEATGVPYGQLLDRLIALALEEFADKGQSAFERLGG